MLLVGKVFAAFRSSLKFLALFMNPHPSINDILLRCETPPSHSKNWAPPSTEFPSSSPSSHLTGQVAAEGLPLDSSMQSDNDMSCSLRQSNSLRRVKRRSVHACSVRNSVPSTEPTGSYSTNSRTPQDGIRRGFLLFQAPQPHIQSDSCAQRSCNVTQYSEPKFAHTPFHSFSMLKEQRHLDSINYPTKSLSYTSLKKCQDSGTRELCSLRRSCGSDLKVPDNPALLVPSVVLTCPTPTEPSSPMFTPRTPITVSKFVSASSMLASSSLPLTVRASPLPSLPQCETCGLNAFDSGTQCAECDHQWLACKVWYRASDSGRRQHLTVPYIRPGESNARNRAILGFLGVPNGSSQTFGLGIQVTSEEKPMSNWRRFARRAAVKTANFALDHTEEFGNMSTLLLPNSLLVPSLATTISALKHLWKVSKIRIPSSIRKLDPGDLALLITGPYGLYGHPIVP